MNNLRDLSVCSLILAAGKGTRMGASIPKVLLPLAGKPILAWVVEATRAAGIDDLGVVIGGDLGAYSELLETYPKLRVFEQTQRRGTADAVASAAVGFKGVAIPSYSNGKFLRGNPLAGRYVLVCLGDCPAIAAATLVDFAKQCISANAAIGVIGMVHPKPTGYGRLVLDSSGRLSKIVEEKDASAKEKTIDLCNTGVIFAKTDFLFELLCSVKTRNAQNEYYLTDCFELSGQKGENAFVYQTNHYQEFDGINDPEQLARVEAFVARRKGV